METGIKLRLLLNDEERKIFDSIIQSFPATHLESAFDYAIHGGVNFQLIHK